MSNIDYQPLPDGSWAQYEHVFNETYWWNDPQTALDELRTELAGSDAGLPTRKIYSLEGAKSYDELATRTTVQLTKVEELQPDSLFAASHHAARTLVHSLVEGIHRNPRALPRSRHKTELEYAHTDTGFLLRRTNTSGQTTYFQGDAWHMVLPLRGRHPNGNLARAVNIDAEPADIIHLRKGDVRSPKQSVRNANVDSFQSRDYRAWIVGRSVLNTDPLVMRQNPREQWNHRFITTSLYTASRVQPQNKQWKPPTKRGGGEPRRVLGFSS